MNKRKLFISIAIAVIVLVVSYVFYQKAYGMEAISQYKPTYFITGNMENQCKYQVSFRYGLLYPYESGLFLGYTQLSHWDIYDRSSPFRETNYNPNIFYEKQNIWKLDFLRIIFYEHKSNGRDGQESRSIDRYFVESEISYGKYITVGIREKVGGFYAISNKNKDIKRYIGFFKTEVFAQIKSQRKYMDHERIYAKGEWTHRFYWVEAGFSCRIITTMFRPHLYVQYYQGYGEFLLDYNKKTQALRGGLIFEI